LVKAESSKAKEARGSKLKGESSRFKGIRPERQHTSIGGKKITNELKQNIDR
jgi:hypothetical protein